MQICSDRRELLANLSWGKMLPLLLTPLSGLLRTILSQQQHSSFSSKKTKQKSSVPTKATSNSIGNHWCM